MANDKPCVHLPLDEIRDVKGTAYASNVGEGRGDAIVHGNPKILHDPTMGTCMSFDGDGDYVELTDLAALTFAQGMTAMAWVRFEATPRYSRIFDLNVAANQSSSIVFAGNEGTSQHLAFGIDGIRFRVENGVALREWRHFAFVYDPAAGKVSIIINGAVAFSKEVTFDGAKTAWKTGYIGKSSWTADRLFRGAIAHFRLYNQALELTEVKDLMIIDKSAMAYYRETTLLKVDLYTIRDDDHKPILYIESDNKTEPLEVSLTNPGNNQVLFKKLSAPAVADESQFHVQLRFRRNVIAPNVLQALQSPTGVVIDGWQHAAGTTADGTEDYISFVKKDGVLTLNKGEAWRIQIPNFSAAAQGGARNTRIQVRYRTKAQDPGSVVRHMEIQSHLGLKTIPLIARFRDSNTLLNNGKMKNELTVEVVYTSDTGSVRLDKASKFELIIDDELLVEGSSLGATSGTNWLVPHVADGIGHKTITFTVTLPADGQTGAAPESLMKVDRQHPLTFALSEWVTNKASGTYNILLRYENIPGYWDGAWVLPVQYSPLVLRSDKIGIGTDQPSADLEIRQDKQAAVGPVLRLTNGEGGENSAAAIDFNVGPVGQGASHDPTFRIEGRNDASNRTDLVFLTQKTPQPDSELRESMRITAEGRVKDSTGFIMPVGAILAYGGSKVPDGWLLCDGQLIGGEGYAALRTVLGERNNVPDLRNRFIIGAGIDYPLNNRGGEASVKLETKHLPSHTHTGVIENADITNRSTPNGQQHRVMHPDTFVRTNVGDEGDDYTVYDNKGNEGPWLSSLINFLHNHTTRIEPTGGDTNHENLPPYHALTYIIKY